MSYPRARSHPAPLTPAQRDLRAATIRWALAHGRPVDPVTLSVIIATKADIAVAEGEHLHRWSTGSAFRFLFGGIGAWCAAHGVARPRHPGETLLTYLAFLDDHARLASGSSRYDDLHESVVELCGLTPDGRRLERRDAAVVLPFDRRQGRARSAAAHPSARRTTSNLMT